MIRDLLGDAGEDARVRDVTAVQPDERDRHQRDGDRAEADAADDQRAHQQGGRRRDRPVPEEPDVDQRTAGRA
jgi:hypothetical protein